MSPEASLDEQNDSALQRLGEMSSKLHFEELLKYATEVCLSKPPDYAAIQQAPTSPEAAVVAKLGLRGLRAAVEISTEYVFVGPRKEDIEPQDLTAPKDDIFFVNLDSPFIYPETWSDPLDIDIINKVRTFGEQLLAEAYRGLGADVYLKIDELKAAQTPAEQMSVIHWLDRRIVKMTNNISSPGNDSVEDDAENKHFYHPARLSPKLTGIYPKNSLTPTCLSISIIAASFFEQAGLNTLHAGVNESGSEKTIGTGIVLTAKTLDDFNDKYSLNLADPTKSAISSVKQKLIDTYKREDAQHAATLVQLMDGQWVQFDPNYSATHLIEEDLSNKVLIKTFGLLDEFRDIAPGLELTTILSGSITSSEMFEDIFEQQDANIIASLKVTARELLLSTSSESIPQAIFDTCVLPFYQQVVDDEYLTLLQEAVTGDRIWSLFTDDYESILQERFYGMFERYVLWGDSIDTFTARVKTDEGYLQNRIDDIIALPFMIAVAVGKKDAEENTPWYTHYKLDIGLPATRIGYAVLSDFAAYDETSALPDSFWMSYWAGNVSVIEHLQQESFSRCDKNVVAANAIYYDIHPFTSTKNYEIIKSFLADNREE